MIRAVTFDVTGTLVHTPRMADIYVEVLGRHGIRLTRSRVRELFPVVWRELDCLTPAGRDRFASYPGGARAWWGRLVERLCELGGTPRPSRFALAELYSRFGRAEAWEVYPEAPAVLRRLRKDGLRLAAISNWDERLPGLLRGLGLASLLETVVISSAVGVAKPDPAIFRFALQQLGVDADAAVHVGDSAREDVEGAVAAGMGAILLDRVGGGAAAISSLDGLPGRLRRGPAASSALV